MQYGFRLITEHMLAQQAPEKWYAQYCKDGCWSELESSPGEKQDIYHRLRDLKDRGALTPESVRKAIGNPSWTQVTCDACFSSDGEIKRAVRVSEDDTKEFSDENENFEICEKCAKDVLKTIRRRQK